MLPRLICVALWESAQRVRMQCSKSVRLVFALGATRVTRRGLNVGLDLRTGLTAGILIMLVSIQRVITASLIVGKVTPTKSV